MNTLIKIKKQLLSNLDARKVTHYCKNLQSPEENSPRLSFKERENIMIGFYSLLPNELIKNIGISDKVNSQTSGLIAFYKNEPCGCILFNLSGKGNLLEPFDFSYEFGKRHAYGYALFVKQEFRSRGIGNLIYLKSFEELKNNFDYLDVFVDSKAFIPNRTVENLGFQKIKIIVLFKMFLFHGSIILDNRVKACLYEVFCWLAKKPLKLLGAITKFPISLLKNISEYIESLFLTAYQITGVNEKEDIKIVFISQGIYDKALFKKILNGEPVIKNLKKFMKTKLSTEFKSLEPTADLIIVDGKFDYLMRSLIGEKTVSFIPQWIVQKNCSFNGLGDFTKSKNRNAHEDVRIVKKYNYDCLFTKDESLLKFFYEDIYLPYANARHKQNKVEIPFNVIRRSFRNGGLMLLSDKGKYLSGAVVELKNNVFHPLFTGVINGDAGLLAKDVLTSLFYFYFKVSQDKGIKNVDLGLSRSFLNDGVLRYKLKWNTKIEFDKKRSNVFALKINRHTNSVNTFLLNNPFISLESGNLIANVFCNSNMEINRGELYKKFKLNGISDLRITVLHEKEEKNERLDKEYNLLCSIQ